MIIGAVPYRCKMSQNIAVELACDLRYVT